MMVPSFHYKKYEVTHFDGSVSLFEVFWGSLTVVQKKLEYKIGSSPSGWTRPWHLPNSPSDATEKLGSGAHLV